MHVITCTFSLYRHHPIWWICRTECSTCRRGELCCDDYTALFLLVQANGSSNDHTV